jgi:hypothetical protein
VSLDVEQRAAASRRRMTWISAAAALLVVLVVLVSISVLAGSGEPTSGAPAPSAAPAQPPPPQVESSARALASPQSSWVPPARQVTLPNGTAQIDEYAVGFPPEPLGAAAAEVAKVRYTSSLDYAQVNAVMRIYAAPALRSVADESSTRTVEMLRRTLDASLDGPAPADRYLVTRPVGVQWRELEPGRVEVQVLVVSEHRTPERSWETLSAARTTWEWLDEAGRGADWRLVDAGPPTARLVDLGSEGFNTEGWSAIVIEDSW